MPIDNRVFSLLKLISFSFYKIDIQSIHLIFDISEFFIYKLNTHRKESFI